MAYLSILITIATLLLGQSAHGSTWAEETGRGSINGQDFPIAIVRNAGSEEHFLGVLRKKFGQSYDIVRLPVGLFGYGSQFLVKPFKDQDLAHLPILKNGEDQGALDRFVLEHAMTFSLFNIEGETLAVGSPVKALIDTMPGALREKSAFPFLKHAVTNAIEMSFQFGAIEVTSLTATLTIPTQDAKVITRSAYAALGMHPPTKTDEYVTFSNGAQRLPQQEFFTDGKSQAANFIINDHGNNLNGSNEVTINVNRVHAKTESR